MKESKQFTCVECDRPYSEYDDTKTGLCRACFSIKMAVAETLSKKEGA